MKSNYKSTRFEEQGRTFQAEFWVEDCCGAELPWVRLCEIRNEVVVRRWPFRKSVVKEVEYEIDNGWTSENRIEMVTSWVNRFLNHEKEIEKERKQIEEFCSR